MKPTSLRKPVVAGQFYPAGAQALKALIFSWADKLAHKSEVIGCILPHAGYIYSGKVAAQTISGIKIKDTVVLLGPNHTGQGATFSIMPQGTWQTPLGDVEIDSKLAGLFLAKSRYLEADSLAHADEHSLEVELPILQYFRPDFKIVPIAIQTDNLTDLSAVGQDLASVVIENGLLGSVMFIASSDLTHYEPQENAKIKDALAIEAILTLDEQELKNRVQESEISMCGFAPIAVLIKAVKLLGAKKGQLIKYQTSGDCLDGDKSSVVGYAGITIN
ncbi:MAG: AmmeMemoRadiSam system protein B [Candidatus Omnitrophica bacterium CG11_big_fil_rev_8_21_14_0_20_43_6]|nr:MAG: AmmeMemoRadiSam system protein B [Candidatus Omnitrophica bacterium CG11_big_fil_rev_8_21_14_0_20_43_6]